MAFSVNQFRDHFAKHNDFAKTAKFDVAVTAPAGLKLNAADLRFQCESTELPGYTINTVDGRYYGVANPVASFPAFGDLTLTFVCAGDFWEKKLFDRWMNLVIPINNYNPNYKDAYTSPKIEINQYSEVANSSENTAPIIYRVAFFEAFPTAIAPMNMNWADDGIHRLVVTFRYEYWSTQEIEQVSRPSVTGAQISSSIGSATGSIPPVVDNIQTSGSTRIGSEVIANFDARTGRNV
jgi:hypothetical protein